LFGNIEDRGFFWVADDKNRTDKASGEAFETNPRHAINRFVGARRDVAIAIAIAVAVAVTVAVSVAVTVAVSIAVAVTVTVSGRGSRRGFIGFRGLGCIERRSDGLRIHSAGVVGFGLRRVLTSATSRYPKYEEAW